MVTPRPNEETCVETMHELIRAHRYPSKAEYGGAAPWVTTLAEHAASLGPWWGDSEALFPYLIVVDGVPAGFDLIAARHRLPRGIEADFVVHEFFVLHADRGSGAAERAAVRGFDRRCGRWEVVTYPSHARGIAFWRRVIGDCASMRFSEGEVDHPWGWWVAFRFDNGG